MQAALVKEQVAFNTINFFKRRSIMMQKTVLSLALLWCSASLVCQSEFSFDNEYVHENILNNNHDLHNELELLKNEPFIAISLGENCFFANHLKEHNLRIRSFPFDWDITPFHALYEIIKNDFQGLLDLINLAIIHHEYTVFNKVYGIKLNHDFDIKDWYDGPEGLTPLYPEILEKYKKTCAYYQRRIARFYGVFTLGIPIYLFRRVINAQEARMLHELFRTKFPQANFKLICIQDKDWDDITAWQNMPKEIMHYRSDAIISYVFNTKNPRATDIFNNLGLM